MFARLDELEEKETANAELAQLGEDKSDEESKTEVGFVKKKEDVRWVQPLTGKDRDVTKKKVSWEAEDVNENDDDSDDDEDEDDATTIAVKFSSSTSLQWKVNSNFCFPRKTQDTK